jgi:hypothetical protein
MEYLLKENHAIPWAEVTPLRRGYSFSKLRHKVTIVLGDHVRTRDALRFISEMLWGSGVQVTKEGIHYCAAERASSWQWYVHEPSYDYIQRTTHHITRARSLRLTCVFAFPCWYHVPNLLRTACDNWFLLCDDPPSLREWTHRVETQLSSLLPMPLTTVVRLFLESHFLLD